MTPINAKKSPTVFGVQRWVTQRVAGVLLAALLLLGCGDGSPGPTAIAAERPAPTTRSLPTATMTPSPSATPAVPTATPAPTAPTAPTATAAPTQLPTTTPQATATAPSATTVQPAATPTPPPAATVPPEPQVTPTVTATSEPQETEEKPELEPTDYDGPVRAIRTSQGLVVAVRGLFGNGYEVVTPCYNVATIYGGLELSGPLDVLIDPGHGGEDESGAVGPNGLKESTVNLQVAELLRALLLEQGYSVELTRYSDHRVSIQSRAALANSLSPRVFMSIHHNGGYPEPFPVAGTEVFVQLDDPESTRLGGLVFEEIQSAFSGISADWMGSEESFGVAWRENQEGTDLYGVLRRTPDLVSVLTEAMFISTEAEAELLAKPETLEAEAQALAAALERWFETDDPGSGFIEGVIFQGDLGNGGGTEGCIDPALS